MRIKAPVKEYDPVSVAESIGDYWIRTQAYKRTKIRWSQGKKFFFVDGPPFTAGRFHLGLARNKIIKDSYLRFMRIQGFDVMDRPGYDMHGLPIEIKVEGSLGISSKKQIDELGVERFVTACTDFSNDYRARMTENFMKLGVWMDWEHPYLTAEAPYIESVWWSLKEAHKKDYLRRAKKVTGWCPRCESPLAQGEVLYKEKEGHSVYIKIPIKGRRDEYIIVWTTTPWTFAGCLAVAVNPEFTYARVAIRQGGRKSTIIVLEDRVEEIAGIANIEAYEILESLKGSQLEKLEFFHPLMGDVQFHKNVKSDWSHKIIALDSVHESHTGAVYISPGLGTADYEVGIEYNLPIFSPVDERGILTTEAGIKYAGQNVSEANGGIITDLKAIRFILHNSREEHRFGHCWRCETPIFYRATEQWFLNVNDVKDVIQKTLRGVNWTPDEFGNKRQHEWILKSADWCVSRQRYWGTPMPIWECITDVCGHVEVVDSIKSLNGAAGYSEGMDLHRPWIDKVSLECPKCGGLMKRVTDIVDVWFDSSVASWAQLGYPKKKKAFKDLWPGDWIAEGQEQAKGWFHNQMCSSVMMFNKMPFKNALAHGMVLDDKGKPVNNSDSEYSNAGAAIGLYGPDALRLFILKIPPWDNARFHVNEVRKTHRTLNVLWNTYVFSASYMRMDSWDSKDKSYAKVRKDMAPEDIWLLSKLETVTSDVKRAMDSQSLHIACKHIEEFILDDLSRWYIKIVRDRLWKEGSDPVKEAAFYTLNEALVRLAVISSPIIPFISERIYQELDGTELSVAMVAWPETDGTRLADGMERNMKHVRNIVRTSNKLRQELGLQIRWPVRKMTISASNEEVADSVKMFGDLIKKQSNIKELELVPENQEWAGQELIVVPNPNIIGKAYKQWESKIARMLKVRPAKEIKAKIDETGEYTLGIEGQIVRILPDMVHFETKLPEGVVSMKFDEGVLYFDTHLDSDLMAEGYAREVIRRIQDMRKEMKLDPEEFIKLSVKLSDELLKLLDEWLEKVADATRASQMEIVGEVEGDDYIVEWPIEQENVTIGITSLNIKKAMDEFTGIKDVDKELAVALVEYGITDSTIFLETDREQLLKIPGMTHSKHRKIKEYFETPEDLRQEDEQRCILCQGIIDPGASNCHRCGKSQVGDEDLDVEIIGEIGYYEEEYEEEVPRERVRIEKRRKPVEEAPPQPEDEIVKMAVDEDKEPSPEDLITSEIMSSISDDVLPAPKPAAEPSPEPPAVVPEQKAPEPEQKPPEPEQKVPESMRGTTEPEKMAPGREQTVPESVQKTQEPETPSALIVPVPVRMAERDDTPAEEEVQPPGEMIPEEVEPDEKEEVAVSDKEPTPQKEYDLSQEDADTIEETFMRDIDSNGDDYHGEDIATKSDIIDSDMDKSISAMAEAFGVKASVAKTLYKSGYNSMESLEKASEEDLRQIKGIGKVTARRIVQTLSREKTKMCSLCNAIVPEDAAVCPRCSVRFISQDEEEARNHEKSMATLDMLDKKLLKKPDDANLLHSKAMTLKDAGKEEEALEVVEKALEISPENGKLQKLKDELAPADEPAPLEPETKEKDQEPKRIPEPEELASEEIQSEDIPEEPRVESKPETEDRLESELTSEMAPEVITKTEYLTTIPVSILEPPEEPVREEPVEEAPKEEPQAPVEETPEEEEVRLRESFTYLIPEERSARSYKLFKDSIDKGMPGYCVTRTFPEKIRERYQLGEIPILWLSNVAKEDAVRPKDLEKLSLSLEEFLSRQGGIVLLDGIEYLITNNNFITVLKLIQSLRDQVAINRSILLLSINPSTMDTHQINLLRREVDSVIE